MHRRNKSHLEAHILCLRSKGYNPVSVWDSGLQFKPQKLIPASSSAVNVLCSTARLCCRISPLLSAFWKEKDLELGIFCVSQPHSLYLLEPGGSRKALLWSCTHGSYQPLLEGTVSHEDPHTAALVTCTLVLGRLCGSAGCTWILLKDLTS